MEFGYISSIQEDFKSDLTINYNCIIYENCIIILHVIKLFSAAKVIYGVVEQMLIL